MQVICTDGTTFTCAGYLLTEYGVKLLDEDPDADEDRYDSEPSAVGYVPHDRLWYILPDGVTPNAPSLSSSAPQPNGPPSGAPVRGDAGGNPPTPHGGSPEPRR